MKKLLFVLVILAVAAATAAYFLSDHGSLGAGAATPVDFKIAKPGVVFGDLSEVVGGTGLVQPQETLAVSTELSGKVVKILADYNDVVESGDDLVQLDDRLAQGKLATVNTDVESAQKAIKVAEVDLERATSQHDAAQLGYNDLKKLNPGVVSEPDLRKAKLALDATAAAVHLAEHNVEMARIRVRTAEEGLKLAQLGVDLSTIKVPFVRRPGGRSRPGVRDVGTILTDGAGSEPKRKYVVMERKVVLNQMVGPPNNTLLFTLVGNLDRVDVHIQVNESDIGKVRPGQKVFFTVSAYQDDNRVFTGEVAETRLLPTVTMGAVTYTVVVTANNEPDGHGGWLLRPGMTTAGVDIVTNVNKNVWAIPNTALDFQLEEAYYPAGAKEALAEHSKGEGWVNVWVRENGAPKLVWVRPQATGKVPAAKDGLLTEPYTMVEWDPDFAATLKADDPKTYPDLIIGAPPAKKPGLFGGGNPLSKVIKF